MPDGNNDKPNNQGENPYDLLIQRTKEQGQQIEALTKKLDEQSKVISALMRDSLGGTPNEKVTKSTKQDLEKLLDEGLKHVKRTN